MKDDPVWKFSQMDSKEKLCLTTNCRGNKELLFGGSGSGRETWLETTSPMVEFASRKTKSGFERPRLLQIALRLDHHLALACMVIFFS